MAEVVKIKSYEELGLSDDFLFCKIMQSNPDLCKELAELVLSRKIGKIISIDKQKPIEITRDGKGVRFDVYMEDDASTVYDIEMQTTIGHISQSNRHPKTTNLITYSLTFDSALNSW